MSEKRALADAMSAVSSVAFRSKSGTMARIDPEETVISDGPPEHAPSNAYAPDGPTRDMASEAANPTTGTLPIMKAAEAVSIIDASEGGRARMPSLVVDVNHEVALMDEAAVPNVFGPRARAASLPDGRGEISIAPASTPKLRPLTYSVLAASEREADGSISTEKKLSFAVLAAIFLGVLLLSAVASYLLMRR
jgi:hypothetical protein